MTTVYVIMGVSGCDKTTVGKALAAALSCPFYDGDDFHSAENVAKMAGGTPLNDDRAPWLATFVALLASHLARNEAAVLACSALKRAYRNVLRVDPEHVQFVYLQGDFDAIRQRTQARSGHYMKAKMLLSQFDALEPPETDEALAVPIAQPIDAIVGWILSN